MPLSAPGLRSPRLSTIATSFTTGCLPRAMTISSQRQAFSMRRFAGRTPALPVGLDHLLGLPARSVGQLSAAEHARHFFGALFAHDGADGGARTSVAFL